MSLQETLLLVHILGAIVWFGGAIMMTIQAGRVAKSGDAGALKAFADHFEWTGLRVMMPAMLAIIVAGVWLVIESSVFEFSDAFVSIGLTVFVLSFILGGAFYGPQSKKLSEMVESGDAGIGALMSKILLVSRIEIAAVTIVVWAMVTKPGG